MSAAATKPRILLVDDEPHVLDSLAAHLSRAFDVATAASGNIALAMLTEGQVFAVVVTDMRMPGTDGVSLLRRFQQAAPDTVRMVLTGHTDLQAALSAINDGHIYRFLSKPCPADKLARAISDGVEQYRRITADRHLALARIGSMEGKLLHAERLATLGTMAAAIAHELGNWTAAFQGILSLVKDKAGAGLPPDAEDLQDLDRIGEHLGAHAKGLLHLARPKARTEERFDLRAVVADTLDLLQSAGITKHANVDMDVAVEPVFVIADRTGIEQVVVNLVKNALDAMHEAPERPSHLRVSVCDDRDGGVARCRIEDNGTGIPRSKKQQVFESYYTSKPAGRGTGLGLPVVKQIIESFGGSISLASAEGLGSTFAFELPGAEQPGG